MKEKQESRSSDRIIVLTYHKSEKKDKKKPNVIEASQAPHYTLVIPKLLTMYPEAPIQLDNNKKT